MAVSPTRGVTESIASIMVREHARTAEPTEVEEKEEVPTLPRSGSDPNAPAVAQWPATHSPAVPAQQTPQTIGTSFMAMQLTEANFIPSDSNGAVGPTNIVALANGRIRVFDKSGVMGSLDTTVANFFAAVGGNSNGAADPHIRYDRLSGRWFVCAVGMNTFNQVLLAVSSGSNISDSSSFTFFAFNGPAAPANFADYPTLGVDKFAVYIGINEYTLPATPVRCTGFVINKASLLSGTLNLFTFRDIGGYSSGIWTPQGVDNDDPSATEGYFVGVDAGVFGRLGIRRVTNPGGTPAMSAQLSVVVPSTAQPIPQPAQGSAPLPLDTLDDRLFAAQVHTNRITGAKTLWTAHSIQVNASGVGSATGGRNGSRWYEIGNLTATPALVQAGTLFDSAPANPIGYWNPSVAMSRQGHMVIGAARAGANAYAGVAVAGRLRGDMQGMTQTPTIAQNGTSSYNVQMSGPSQRWGDYSQTVVDPTDGQTMWTFQQYTNAYNSWGVRVVQLLAPPPATPTTAYPQAVSAEQASVDVTINGASISGSEFFDAGAGFSNRIAASITGGVVVNSITFNSPTQVTLNLSTVGASMGPQSVTLINPDGQSRTANGILTICSMPAPAITAAGPTTFCEGGSVVLTSTTASGYQWYRDAIAIAGATMPTYSATTSGSYTVIARDPSGCTSPQSDPVLVTVNPNPTPAITATESTTFCEGGSLPLISSVTAGIQWYRNGSPIDGATNPTYVATMSGAYTVIATSGSCPPVSSTPVTITVNPIPVAPTIAIDGTTASVASHAGSTYAWTLIGGTITSGQGSATIQYQPGSPGTRMTFTVTESNGGCFSPAATKRALADFADVPAAHPFHDFIVKLAVNGITAGCGGGKYCPDGAVLRSQMAIFLLRGEHGEAYTPPPAAGIFGDVPVGSFGANFIEQLSNEGITAGCGGGNYCPDAAVLRSQMSIFLLRAKHGSSYVPPTAIGLFSDAPVGSFAADWIEQLFNEGVTGGCSVSPPRFCPSDATTRGAMAVFLTRTFNLQ